MPKKYIIGTRGSLLAVTQCTQVKNELERLTGDQFELKIIKTQGDMITTKPLWQLEGKDFFTKELDEALLGGEVDLVVHSYKDLGSIRPDGIVLAAVTERKFAQDILLIKQSTIEKLSSMNEVVVGTSSPRRIYNIERKLADFIPVNFGTKISTKMLRGNVNTRIQKLQNDEFDAIVLAHAGIERLALSESSRQELIPLLRGLNFMLLPQSTFPSSASQGALGIECAKMRNDHGELLEKLSRMNHQTTIDEVARERKAFNSYGGGCHLAVGIHVSKVGPYFWHTHSGVVIENEQERTVHQSYLEGQFREPANKTKVFIGLPVKVKEGTCFDQLINKVPLENPSMMAASQILVTSKYCLDEAKKMKFKTLWAAAGKTHKELVAHGLWCNGHLDGLGTSILKNILDSKVLELINPDKSLLMLTNDQSKCDLPQSNTLACYKRVYRTAIESFRQEIEKCDVFYWTSFPQYQYYVEQFPAIADKFHCCGLGKTWEQFKSASIEVRPFATMEHFNTWANL